MSMMGLSLWWVEQRLCCCTHPRFPHLHYRGNKQVSVNECSVKGCPCERFQWRLLKWVY